MSYLRYYDYLRTIQADNLAQIINSDDGLRLTSEAAAEAEAISYLTQKYDVGSEFSDTTAFSPTNTYKANSLVELNYPDYVPANTYNVNELIIFAASAYICIASTTGTFDSAAWTLIGVKYDLFFVKLPAAAFDYKNYYRVGDEIFFQNKIYTAKLPTRCIDHTTALQYGSTTNLPLINVFPDNAQEGSIYWGAGTPFSITGILPTDDAKWQKGDNRSVQLVQKVIDVCLYHLHSRIAPRNIPQLRIDRYNAAIDWLNMAKTGEITADIPLIQPKRGSRVRWGSQIKNVDEY